MIFLVQVLQDRLNQTIDSDAKAKVEEKRLALKEATEKDDFDLMKSLTEELQKELYALGASVYQQAGAPDPNTATPGDDSAKTSTDSGDDVIDAEFTETK